MKISVWSCVSGPQPWPLLLPVLHRSASWLRAVAADVTTASQHPWHSSAAIFPQTDAGPLDAPSSLTAFSLTHRCVGRSAHPALLLKLRLPPADAPCMGALREGMLWPKPERKERLSRRPKTEAHEDPAAVLNGFQPLRSPSLSSWGETCFFFVWHVTVVKGCHASVRTECVTWWFRGPLFVHYSEIMTRRNDIWFLPCQHVCYCYAFVLCVVWSSVEVSWPPFWRSFARFGECAVRVYAACLRGAAKQDGGGSIYMGSWYSPTLQQFLPSILHLNACRHRIRHGDNHEEEFCYMRFVRRFLQANISFKARLNYPLLIWVKFKIKRSETLILL